MHKDQLHQWPGSGSLRYMHNEVIWGYGCGQHCLPEASWLSMPPIVSNLHYAINNFKWQQEWIFLSVLNLMKFKIKIACQTGDRPK